MPRRSRHNSYLHIAVALPFATLLVAVLAPSGRGSAFWAVVLLVGAVASMVGIGFFVASVITYVAFGRWRTRNSEGSICCHKCGYDLTGNTSGVCPECGERI